MNIKQFRKEYWHMSCIHNLVASHCCVNIIL